MVIMMVGMMMINDRHDPFPPLHLCQHPGVQHCLRGHGHHDGGGGEKELNA